jgi:hypothetical protein
MTNCLTMGWDRDYAVGRIMETWRAKYPQKDYATERMYRQSLCNLSLKTLATAAHVMVFARDPGVQVVIFDGVNGGIGYSAISLPQPPPQEIFVPVCPEARP